MKAVVCRVNRAICRVDGEITGEVGVGLLIFAGFSDEDTESDVIKVASKIGRLRIFRDDNGKINKSVSDVSGGALVISNFTLYGRVKHSNRPDFMHACPSERANGYFELFKRELAAYMPVQSGVFGAHMHIETENDGPVTLVIESSEL